MASDLKLPPSNFQVRQAQSQDIPAMTDVVYHSFNAPFWKHLFPDNPVKRQWWYDAWQLGIDTHIFRNFVVVDSNANGRVVAFSRWIAPQEDGNLDSPWPEVKEKDWDMEVAGRFFGGMEENRKAIMGSKPHWFLDLLGVHEDYQKRGIGAMLVKWGTDEADTAGMETILHASEIGQPFYKTYFGFRHAADIDIPKKPPYGQFHYVTIVRPPKAS